MASGIRPSTAPLRLHLSPASAGSLRAFARITAPPPAACCQTDSGQGGSPGCRSGTTGSPRGGTPTDSPWRSGPSRRPGGPGSSLMPPPAGPKRHCRNGRHTSRCTTPKHSHACHTTPTHSAAFDQLDGFACLRSHRTTQSRQAATHHFRTNTMLSFPLGTRIPIQPPLATDIHGQLPVLRAATKASHKTTPRLPNSPVLLEDYRLSID